VTDTVKDISAEQVASFLRRHTDFLLAYPDLAMTLNMPREQGSATSLASYQLEVLREKNREQSKRLHELIQVAHDNEQLMRRVHQLSLRLLRAHNLAETLQQVAASLREDFLTDLVKICLVGLPKLSEPRDYVLQPDEEDPQLQHFADFLRSETPLCGRLRPEKLRFLFAANALSVQSAVLIPIRGSGFLAIGSIDANRFHPGMGIAFLGMMSELISGSIRSQPK
jgi:uncharacterized protein